MFSHIRDLVFVVGVTSEISGLDRCPAAFVEHGQLPGDHVAEDVDRLVSIPQGHLPQDAVDGHAVVVFDLSGKARDKGLVDDRLTLRDHERPAVAVESVGRRVESQPLVGSVVVLLECPVLDTAFESEQPGVDGRVARPAAQELLGRGSVESLEGAATFGVFLRAEDEREVQRGRRPGPSLTDPGRCDYDDEPFSIPLKRGPASLRCGLPRRIV